MYEFYSRIQRLCGLETAEDNASRGRLIESLLGTDAHRICVQMAADLDLGMKSSLLWQSGRGGQLPIIVDLNALANTQIAAALGIENGARQPTVEMTGLVYSDSALL